MTGTNGGLLTAIQRLFNTSQDLILVADQQGKLIEVSPSAKTILGRDPKDMIGHDRASFVHLSDTGVTRTELERARMTGIARPFECRYIHADGHPVVLNWTGVYVPEDKQYYLIGRDISEPSSLSLIRQVDNSLRDIESRLEVCAAGGTPWYFSDAHLLEVMLIPCSLWACYVLATDGGAFMQGATAVGHYVHLDRQREAWAAIAGTAAILKAIGLRKTSNPDRLSVVLPRVAGLGLSGLFWTVIGVSSLWANTESLAGVSGTALGLLAWWLLLRIAR